jgi:AcrR family transcriptional regulator
VASQRDTRRVQILEAAGRIVRQRGFSETRMADVAGELGVAPSLIVYHFGTKDELLAQTLAAETTAELARLTSIVELDLSATERMELVLTMSLGAGSKSDWELWIDAWGEAQRSEALRVHLVELDRQWRRSLEPVVTAGMHTGEFAIDDPPESVERILAQLDGYGVMLVLRPPRRSGRSVLDAACRAVGSELGVVLAPRRLPARTPG